ARVRKSPRRPVALRERPEIAQAHGGFVRGESDDARRLGENRRRAGQDQQGVEIQKHEFNYALSAVNEPTDGNVGELAETKITVSPRKPAIVARSAGQRAYIEAIKQHDIVFGIGPAGTGKTYLAVAMAVAALKKDLVQRIILTRPAVEAGEAL